VRQRRLRRLPAGSGQGSGPGAPSAAGWRGKSADRTTRQCVLPGPPHPHRVRRRRQL